MTKRSAAFLATAVCLSSVIAGCGTETLTTSPSATTATSPSSASRSSSGTAPAQEATSGEQFAYCPTPPAPKPNEILEPLYIDWQGRATDPDLLRDQVTWIGSGVGEGPGGNQLRIRAIDQSGGTERETTGLFDERTAGAIRWALANDAKVLTATVPRIRKEGYVGASFVIIFPADADPFFVGECAKRDWELNLRKIFGDDYAKQVALLAKGPISLPDDPQPQVTFLLPGDAPDALLASLNHITLEFDLPDQWAGAELDESHVLITKVDAGWNEALPLTWPQVDARSTRIGAYVPNTGKVELWVLGNDGDIREQVNRLAVFEAAELVRLSKSGTMDNAGVVRVSIASALSAAEVAHGAPAGEVTLSGLE